MTPNIETPACRKVIVSLAVAGMAAMAGAATISSTGGDSAGKSSFDSGLIFGGAPHPTAGNDYVVISSHVIRTPDFVAKVATNVVFRGDSLSLGNGSSRGQFALKTVYPDDSKRATVTINDFRIYAASVLNMASEKKGRIAGNMTIYATSSKPARFQCSTSINRIFEIASTITGATGTGIQFENALETSEFRLTGDMSGYLGTVLATCNGGRLVLACPYAAASSDIGSTVALTLGPNFSYVGTGTMAIPAGTRFTAGYDADTGTTVPVTLDAEHFTLAAGNFEVALDADSLPAAAGYAGKTLPVVRIPRALREVTEADFTDATTGVPAEYGLPSRSVKVETDGAGMQIVSIVTYPYAKLSDAARTTDNPARSSGQWYLADAGTWSDNAAPTPDKDYLAQDNAKGSLRTSAGQSAPYVFTGRSLTLAKSLANKNGELVVTNFVLCGGSLINAAGAGSTVLWQAINGTMRFADTSWDNGAAISGTAAHYNDIRSSLSGDGTFLLKVYDSSKTSISHTRARLSGDNSAFTGQIRLYSYYYENNLTNEALVLEFDTPENLGGAPAEFDYRAIGVGKGCSLAPSKPMTLATANRGIWVDTLGRICVTNGTFGIMQPIRMTGTIRKEGTGVLALGGPVAFGQGGADAPSGANNVLEVSEGGILPLSTNGFANLAITFAEGSRLIADAVATDADVRTYGLFNTYGAFTLPSDGKLHATIVGGPDGDVGYSVALCTVTPSAAAALDGNIVVDGIRNRAIAIRSESVTVGEEQMVRFTADVRIAGFTVIFR